jgi:hypothetical protein
MAISAADARSAEDPEARLEQALIDEYLRTRGYERAAVDVLPAAERTALLQAASRHAAVRLAEVEARARLLRDLEGGT